MRRATVAVDVGGTFTDVTLVEPGSRRWFRAKVPSNAEQPQLAFADGLRRVMSEAAVHPAQIGRIVHATTLATNTIVESSGPTVALVCTRGFRHVLEIGRHDGPRRISMFAWAKPERPVPPALVFEVDERMAADGTVLHPLDAEQCREVGRRLRHAGIDSIAISFINSYASSAHEERAAELIAEVHPAATLSISSRVLPVFREYERTLATALNAYVWPAVDRYLLRLEEHLRPLGITARTFVMQSNGGHVSPAQARRRPIALVHSGPAACAAGAATAAARARYGRAILVDMGGTSTDVCVLRGGEPELTDAARVGTWLIALPSVDVQSIGAGGGSIVRVAPDGSIAVGPESAGSRPGPACYGMGGAEPTVTDAHLVLGRLPMRLAGGRLNLDRRAAERVLEDRVARPLGIDLHAAAHGVLEVVNHNMLGAIRLVSTQRGRDPRGYTLVCAGGAGPLHAAEVGALLGCARVLIPPAPGVLSTAGLLQSPLRRDFAATNATPLDECEPGALEAAFARLEAEATAWFEAEGTQQRRRRHHRQASLRYADQAAEVTVDWPGGADPVAALQTALRDRHCELFGYAPEGSPAELVGLRVIADGGVTWLQGPAASGKHRPPRAGECRPVYLGARTRFRSLAVHQRADLAPTTRLDGPAIVEQMDSTTFIPPGFRCRVDRQRNLIIETRPHAPA